MTQLKVFFQKHGSYGQGNSGKMEMVRDFRSTSVQKSKSVQK